MFIKINIENQARNIRGIMSAIIIIFTVIIVAKTAFAVERQISNTPSLNEISKLKESPKWSDRMRAASKILSSTNFDTSLAVNIIIEGINKELKDPSIPTLSDIRGGASANGWNDIIPVYINNLNLLGESILPQLKSFCDSSSGEIKSWIFIARGLLSDSVVHDEIIMFLTNKNPNMRAMAIKSLAYISIPSDIELFKNSLNDSFCLMSSSDISIDGGKSLDNKTIYPVRFEAIKAIQNLGYKVLPDSSGGYIINKK
jgi:HEAT repeat protein